jgi:phosphohistidine phosphatase
VRLWIVRHAEAVERGLLVRDAARPLTPEGHRRFERAVRGLEQLGVRLDLVLHSPRLRAIETADLLAPVVRGRFAVTPNLNRSPREPLLGELRGREVAVVGHEPWLSELAAWLVTGRREDSPRFSMRKGAVLVLEGAPEPGGMSLEAAYPPRALRRLGK